MPRYFYCLLFFFAAGHVVQAQELSLFESFTDNAVLQRDMVHPIWGWTKRRRKVTVNFQGVDYKTKADASGRWQVELPATKAGGPFTITVAAGRERRTLKNVYFGDVYLLSGQSNMEWRLTQSDPDGSRAAAIADPMIRELKVQKSYASSPQEHLDIDEGYSLNWMKGDESIADFSAVGSYFAHYLREEIDVPIGLLHASWGGSRIEPWMSPEALGIDPAEALEERDNAIAAAGRKGMAAFKANFPGRELPKTDIGKKMDWLNPDHNDVSWPTMKLPTFWEAAGYPSVDGIFYFRGTFFLTEKQARSGGTLYLGAIDDGDWTYINGVQVGATPNAYSEPRVYKIKPGVLQAGTNKIAFRIYDGQGGGGFSADPGSFYLETPAGKVSLAGDYKYNIGEFRVDAQPNQVATILYNAMIAPLEGYPIKGVLWYQGESNAGSGDNLAYADLMKGLVTSWRDFFDQPDLPFYWVQLANFMDPVKTPNEPGWAILRESQTKALELPRTGQAVITDIGEANDIHPRNKWEVGRRLSLHALKDIYGKEVQACSPMLKDVSQMAGITFLEFTEVGRGLMVRSDDRYGYPTGFTVMDDAGEWHFAQAQLHAQGNKISVVNPAGTGIKIIRYNWANNPDGNLFSKDGLPLTPFEVKVGN